MNDDRERHANSIVRVPGSGLTVARSSLVRRGLDLIEQPSEVMVWETDGSEMVYVPEGEFPMGITEQEARRWHEEFGGDLEWYMWSTPSHRVYLDAFYIGRYPVTNAQYARFVQDTGHPVPYYNVDWVRSHDWDRKGKIPPPGKENHPVVLVNWYDAQAYCEWAGLRLPTEAEWEKAASWDVRAGCKLLYPWGDRWDSDKCNSAECLAGYALPTYDEWYNWWRELSPVQRQDTTTRVGTYSPTGDSPSGCADMSGNVWEWVADWLEDYPSGWQANATGPASGEKMLRGGSWHDSSDRLRSANRYNWPPEEQCGLGGFRCARSS